jgi:protein TonB
VSSSLTALQSPAHDVRPDAGMLVDVVVLSDENALYESIRHCIAERNPLWRARTAEQAVDMLLLGRSGVLIVDMASVSTQPASLIERIHGQFPDVVIVVAGVRDDEPALAGLVSDGLVYRYMHKPLSARRAGMFLGAAIRQYAERRERRDFEPLRPLMTRLPDRVGPRYWLLSAVLIFSVVATVTVLTHDEATESPEPVSAAAPAATSQQAATRSDPVLSRARAALAAGRLEAPEGRNALDLYRAVLLARPEHAEAQAGLARTLIAIVTQAEARAQGGDRAEALRLLQRVLEAEPGHARAQSLLATLEPPVVAPAAEVTVAPAAVVSEAPAAEVPAAPAAARVSAAPGAVVSDASPAVETRAVAGTIGAALAARAQTPHAIVPATPDASTAKAATPPGPSRSSKPVRDPLQPALAMTSATRTGVRTRTFGAPISTGHAIAGVDRQPPGAGTPRAARSIASPAGEIDANGPRVPPDRVPASERTAITPPEFVDSRDLSQTVLVEPEYPAAAVRAGQEGWVTVGFTVGERGDVRDALLTDAEPAGVFDAAALEAVRQWRFEPRVSNGRAVPVRSSVTLRFAVDR